MSSWNSTNPSIIADGKTVIHSIYFRPNFVRGIQKKKKTIPKKPGGSTGYSCLTTDETRSQKKLQLILLKPPGSLPSNDLSQLQLLKLCWWLLWAEIQEIQAPDKHENLMTWKSAVVRDHLPPNSCYERELNTHSPQEHQRYRTSLKYQSGTELRYMAGSDSKVKNLRERPGHWWQWQ